MAVPPVIALRAASGPVPPPPAPAEWTFEAAKRVWKPMTRAVQHVGIPGYGWQAGVFWDGGLLIGPQGEARFLSDAVWQQESAPLGFNLLEVAVGYGDPPKFLERPCMMDSHVKRSLEDGRLPIPNVRTEDGDLVWNETVCAHLFDRRMEEGMKPRREDLLVIHAQFKVRNTGRRRGTGHLWLYFGDTSQVTVSYTHLDVYKRQVQGRRWICGPPETSGLGLELNEGKHPPVADSRAIRRLRRIPGLP